MLNSKFRLRDNQYKILTKLVTANTQGTVIEDKPNDVNSLLFKTWIKPHKLHPERMVITQLGYGVWRSEHATRVRYAELIKLFDRLKAKELQPRPTRKLSR